MYDLTRDLNLLPHSFHTRRSSDLLSHSVGVPETALPARRSFPTAQETSRPAETNKRAYGQTTADSSANRHARKHGIVAAMEQKRNGPPPHPSRSEEHTSELQ